MMETFSMVKDQIEKKGYLKHLGGGVVITGGGSLLQGGAELAQEIFGIPARVGYPLKVGGLVEEYQSPIYSTGVGLVLYGAALMEAEGFEPKSGKYKTTGFLKRLKDWMGEFF